MHALCLILAPLVDTDSHIQLLYLQVAQVEILGESQPCLQAAVFQGSSQPGAHRIAQSRAERADGGAEDAAGDGVYGAREATSTTVALLNICNTTIAVSLPSLAAPNSGGKLNGAASATVYVILLPRFASNWTIFNRHCSRFSTPVSCFS